MPDCKEEKKDAHHFVIAPIQMCTKTDGSCGDDVTQLQHRQAVWEHHNRQLCTKLSLADEP